MAGPQIVLEGLTRRYGRLTAVDDVDLAVGRGEIFVVDGGLTQIW